MVRFGTSGWRGIIGRELTFRRVRMVVQAMLETLREEETPVERIVVGFDTRMLSEKFAAKAAELIAANGVVAELTPRDVPSPVVACMVIERGAAAGITFTGSHNPPEYNGLKIYTADGILASQEFTDRVEERFDELENNYDDTFLPRPKLVGEYDPKPKYLERLQGLIDWESMRKANIRLVVDPLFGSAREYLDHILLENEVETDVIHNTRDPHFGGYAPDCTSENLSRLREVMRHTGADLGLSTDGDGDRFGILDHGARLVDSTTALAVTLDYLARRRGLEGGVGYTVATSGLINAVARHHGLELYETAVGFKNFGPLLVDGTLEYAGEESAGLAWSKHLPERDGVLACLLAAEMVAVEGKTLTELAHDLTRRVGTYSFRRTQIPLTQRTQEIYEKRLGESWSEINGFKVADIDRRDGLKLIFESGGWVLVRIAGTEPKIRLYTEGRSSEEQRHLMHLARQLFS
ncbi:MAG: phosphoglucomutase/phosphomannomutase family protein [Acidobacteria bacterium]|jgi:phosphoglucomutase|nr:phosphoglucomutase/phosphomannomutase family protein [Acidobacteriota bacterium]